MSDSDSEAEDNDKNDEHAPSPPPPQVRKHLFDIRDIFKNRSFFAISNSSTSYNKSFIF